jgi:hypothetical protein
MFEAIAKWYDYFRIPLLVVYVSEITSSVCHIYQYGNHS